MNVSYKYESIKDIPLGSSNKIEIMMIDISCKFYLQNNDVYIDTAST